MQLSLLFDSGTVPQVGSFPWVRAQVASGMERRGATRANSPLACSAVESPVEHRGAARAVALAL